MSRFSSILLSIVAVFLFVNAAPLLFAEELILEFDPDENAFLQEGELVQSTIFSDQPRDPQLLPQAEDIEQYSYLQGYQQLFQFNQQEQAGLQAVLLPVKEDITNIDTQLNVLNLQMQRIRQLQELLRQKLFELQQLETKLSVQEQLLALEMKDVLKKFERILLLYYRLKRQYVGESGDLNSLQLLTSAESPADLMFQNYVLQDVQDQLLFHIGNVSQQQVQLDQLRGSVELIQFQLQQYADRADRSETVLAQQQAFQEELLADKEREQSFFQQQLTVAQAEQETLLRRIQSLATGFELSPEQQFPLESFIWPVAPVLGISAHFQEQSYKARFGVDHNAVDIPTDQLTPVQAPLSGTVLTVHDGGLGYSYIQLGHRDELSTVYGHMYSFAVQEGETVEQGQVIGLSGGALGTNGAGRLTTGPHLHFEVLKNGQHVDPLDYLPELSSED